MNAPSPIDRQDVLRPEAQIAAPPTTQLQWTDNTVPDKPGLWAYMSPQGKSVCYQPVSQVGAEHPERWDLGRWCRVGPVPEITLPEMTERTGPWKCFHCDEVFETVKDAGLHFGDYGSFPACTFEIEHIRHMERELAKYREEDTDLHRQIGATIAKHQTELRRAEELGYSRGLHDSKLIY